jgi:hypothetical protein
VKNDALDTYVLTEKSGGVVKNSFSDIPEFFEKGAQNPSTGVEMVK